MISLTDTDRKFYRENAPALIGYMRYVEYVLQNRENFGGNENVELALRIGKFIGRNEIDPTEFEQVKLGVSNLCKNNEKAQKVMVILQNEEKLQKLVRGVIETSPKEFMIYGPDGEILSDTKGNPVPNLMKISLAIAKEING